jgi:release factor glutamine methyltransferase
MTETEIVFTSLLKCDRVSLYLDKDRRLTGEQSRSAADTLRRRLAGEPLEYILGTCEFMGIELLVDSRVLVPRPETELLVETVLARAPKGCSLVADLGTGSGAIAVSLALSLPSASLVCLDISPGALACCRENGRRNGCAPRMRFVRADMRAGLAFAPGSFDMIVSNPPYVASRDIPGLQPEVRSEPAAALDGGSDGLAFYRAIARHAPAALRQGGLLAVEIGAGQCREVTDIFEASGSIPVREVIKDYAGIERVIIAGKV